MVTKRLIYLLAFLVFTGLLYAAGESPGPILEFALTTWDFGSIREGEVVSHVFEFKNTGNEELIISDIQSTCGSCTTVTISSRKIAPGKKGEVTVTFDSHNYEGEVWRKVYLITNNKEEPTSMLSFKAEVVAGSKPVIELIPKLQDLGFILEGKETGCKIKIANKGASDLEISKIFTDDQSSYKKLSFKLNNKDLVLPLKIAKNQEKELEVIFIPNKNSGEYYLNICFNNNSVRPNYYLNIKANIISRENLQELFNKYRSELERAGSK